MADYLDAWESGVLQERIRVARELLRNCTLCPRRCGVDRLAGEEGYCRTGELAEVASWGAHFGEESVLVGEHGSGTIFFCGCSLGCLFCQNWDISRHESGSCATMEAESLGQVMVELQQQGCHNINLVTPSHFTPQILAALPHAIRGGLHVPLVYNCSGYEEVASLRLLGGIVDIYMPDFKFWEEESARRYANAPDYPQKAREALIEMHRQVGDLVIDDLGVAQKGLLVRHLLMPEGQDETREILRFLAEEISPSCYTNIMDQYRPCGRLDSCPELQQTVGAGQYQAALELAEQFGLSRLDRKDVASLLRRLFEEE